MKTETIKRKINTNGILIYLLALIFIDCGGNCEQQIVIYQGQYFKEGEIFQLSIDEKILFTERFETELQRNIIKEIETYCCLKDSCTVKFVLGDNDTIFFISPRKTKRLMVGSDIYGGFSVATDEDKRAWVKM